MNGLFFITQALIYFIKQRVLCTVLNLLSLLCSDGGAAIGSRQRFQWLYETNEVPKTRTLGSMEKQTGSSRLSVDIQPGDIMSFLVTLK